MEYLAELVLDVSPSLITGKSQWCHQTPTLGQLHFSVWTATCPGGNLHYSQLSLKFQISLPLLSFPAAVLTACLPH